MYHHLSPVRDFQTTTFIISFFFLASLAFSRALGVFISLKQHGEASSRLCAQATADGRPFEVA